MCRTQHNGRKGFVCLGSTGAEGARSVTRPHTHRGARRPSGAQNSGSHSPASTCSVRPRSGGLYPIPLWCALSKGLGVSISRALSCVNVGGGQTRETTQHEGEACNTASSEPPKRGYPPPSQHLIHAEEGPETAGLERNFRWPATAPAIGHEEVSRQRLVRIAVRGCGWDGCARYRLTRTRLRPSFDDNFGGVST